MAEQKDDWDTYARLANFNEVNGLNYKDQCLYFINAFWDAGLGENDPDQIFDIYSIFVEVDNVSGADGSELDTVHAMKLFETMGSGLSMIQLKKKLKAVDANNNGKMSAVEFLLDRFGRSVEDLMARPTHTNPAWEKCRNTLDECDAEIAKFHKQLSDKEAACESASGVKAMQLKNEVAQMKLTGVPPELVSSKARAETALKKAIRNDTGKKADQWWAHKVQTIDDSYKPKANFSFRT